jgi:hypothetical protein
LQGTKACRVLEKLKVNVAVIEGGEEGQDVTAEIHRDQFRRDLVVPCGSFQICFYNLFLSKQEHREGFSAGV